MSAPKYDVLKKANEFYIFDWILGGEREKINFDIYNLILFLIIIKFVYICDVVVISKTKIIEFYENVPAAKESLIKWYHITELSDWNDFHTIKETFNSVDSIGNDRYVFNVGGNKYRIVAMIHFSTRTIYLRFVGTHKQYDEINCKVI